MTRIKRVNTVGGSISKLFPSPRIAKRAPTTADKNFPQGQHWIDEDSQAFYFLVAFTSSGAIWQSNTSSGTTATVFTVNPGDLTVTAGDFFVTLGDSTFGGAVTIAGLTTLADVSVSGTLTFTGDIDLVSASAIDLTSTQNAADCIKIWAKDGAIQTLHLLADTSTLANSIDIESTVGGITLNSGLASADAINLSASAGGVDIDGALQVNIASSQNAVDAIRIVASAGGIDIDAVGTAGEDINLTNTTGSIVLTSSENIANAVDINCVAGGVEMDGILQMHIGTSQAAADAIDLDANGGGITIAAAGAAGGVGDVTVTSASGSLYFEATEAVTDCIQFFANGGGITASSDLDTLFAAAGSCRLESSEATADAVRLRASDAAGGFDFDCGTNGVAWDTTGNYAFISTASSAIAISLQAITGAGGCRINTATGGIDMDSTGVIDAVSSFAGAGVVINSSDAAGQVTVDAGSGGIQVGLTGDCTPISIGDVAPIVSRVFTIAGGTVTGGFTDTIDIGPDGVSTVGGATKVVNILPGSTTLGAQTVNIGTGNRVSGAQTVNISTGTGTKQIIIGNADAMSSFGVSGEVVINNSVNASVGIQTGTSTGQTTIGNNLAGAVTIDSGAGLSLGVAATSDWTLSAGDLSLTASTGSINIVGAEAAVNAIVIDASDAAGGIDIDAGTAGIAIDSTGGINIDAATASQFTCDNGDLLIQTTNVGSVIIDSGEGVFDSIFLTCTHAAGGIAASVGTGGFYIQPLTNGPFTVETGTGAINIGVDAAAHTATFGSTFTTSTTQIQGGTGGVHLTSTDEIGIASTGHIELNSTGGNINIGNNADTGSISIATGPSARTVTMGNSTGATSVTINNGTGVLSLGTNAIAHVVNIGNSTGATQVNVDSGTAGINIGTLGIAMPITIGNSTGATSVAIEAGSGAVLIGANAVSHSTTVGSATGASLTQIRAGTSGVIIDADDGIVKVTSTFNTIASPTVTTTINKRVFAFTGTGFTTASGAVEVFTLTNSFAATDGHPIVVASNEGANDAQMTVTRVQRTAGTLVITVTNNGAAALNGNLTVTGWILNEES